MIKSIRLAMPLFFLVALIVGGRVAANQYGWALNTESLDDFQRWISSLGWMGPAAFLLLTKAQRKQGLKHKVEAGNANRPQREATNEYLIVHRRTVHCGKVLGKQTGTRL